MAAAASERRGRKQLQAKAAGEKVAQMLMEAGTKQIRMAQESDVALEDLFVECFGAR